MVGHIAVPALDPSGAPATLSAPISTTLLRERLGFRGLVVTDALEMAGARAAWNGEAAIRAVQAGADMVLLPPQPEVAVQSLVRAVREGQLSEARLDASVLRILELKERLGLHRQRLVDPDRVSAAVGRPEDVARALAIARSSITVVRNEQVLPLRAEEPLRLLHLAVSSDVVNARFSGIPEAELSRRRVPVETRSHRPGRPRRTPPRSSWREHASSRTCSCPPTSGSAPHGAPRTCRSGPRGSFASWPRPAPP